jgi:hypothetical protein
MADALPTVKLVKLDLMDHFVGKLEWTTLSFWREEKGRVEVACDGETLWVKFFGLFKPEIGAFAIGIEDIQALSFEDAERITVGRVILLGVLAPLWKKKEKFLVVDFVYDDESQTIILGGPKNQLRRLYDDLRLKVQDARRAS